MLRDGHAGDLVRTLQTGLKALGFRGVDVTGNFRGATEAAVLTLEPRRRNRSDRP